MTIRMLTGDARAVLLTLPAESVHCVVTSPPYYGLRDYGTAQWAGGDAECDHQPTADEIYRAVNAKSRLNGGFDNQSAGAVARMTTNPCHRCGAQRIDSQLGLEPSPIEYIASMVGVFREVRRVLRSDGTLWLNIGDSYAGSGKGTPGPNALIPHLDRQGFIGEKVNAGHVPRGYKAKDLLGIPWMLAFALRDDGWYLRSDIIWSKPNPMPESVTDRPTKAHEYLFLLSKRARYFYDADAIRESHAVELHAPGNKPAFGEVQRNDFGTDRMAAIWGNPAGRNKRSVWEIATEPYPDAHFATYPTALVEPCIKAGCPPGGTVLDPFAGAGTTLLVADRLQRNAIGIELSPTYATLATSRLVDDCPMFTQLALV